MAAAATPLGNDDGCPPPARGRRLWAGAAPRGHADAARMGVGAGERKRRRGVPCSAGHQRHIPGAPCGVDEQLASTLPRHSSRAATGGWVACAPKPADEPIAGGLGRPVRGLGALRLARARPARARSSASDGRASFGGVRGVHARGVRGCHLGRVESLLLVRGEHLQSQRKGLHQHTVQRCGAETRDRSMPKPAPGSASTGSNQRVVQQGSAGGLQPHSAREHDTVLQVRGHVRVQHLRRRGWLYAPKPPFGAMQAGLEGNGEASLPRDRPRPSAPLPLAVLLTGGAGRSVLVYQPGVDRRARQTHDCTYSSL